MSQDRLDLWQDAVRLVDSLLAGHDGIDTGIVLTHALAVHNERFRPRHTGLSREAINESFVELITKTLRMSISDAPEMVKKVERAEAQKH